MAKTIRVLRLILAIGVVCWTAPGWAAEGSTVAGPIGGTDIRSAFHGSPGLYGAIITGGSNVYQLRDGAGNPRAGLNAVGIDAGVAGLALVYVPEFKLFDGSVSFLGVTGGGSVCGQITSANPRRCRTGLGDLYTEVSWSRFFGFTRPSQEKGAAPIREGLAISTGIGMMSPVGLYDSRIQASNGVTVGSNTRDIAPSIAFTYTTPALLAEGTEFSAKLYLNNYARNADTNYRSGRNTNVDFAISEHIGRWQVGVAGYYLRQFEDDVRAGVSVAPDGRRSQVLALGPVLNYDLPEYKAAIKLKVRTSVFAYNTAMVSAFYLTFARKLY